MGAQVGQLGVCVETWRQLLSSCQCLRGLPLGSTLMHDWRQLLRYWIMSFQIACGTIRGICPEAMRTGGVGRLPVRGSAVIGKAMQIIDYWGQWT